MLRDDHGMIRPSRGMTLIELMVALGIGAFLMIGAFTVFVNSRVTFRTNEAVSRLQENARYVLEVIEPDIRMANFWGLSNRPDLIANRATPDDPVSPLSPAGDCGSNWTIHLDRPVEASNNAYAFRCRAYGSAVATADTLVVRRASVAPITTSAANTLYIQASRVGGAALFDGSTTPPDLPTAGRQTHELVVNGYYVSENSTLDTPGNPVPSLRRKFLRNGGARATIADEEILPGVEDLQIQFGLDTGGNGPGQTGSVDRYVNPNDPILDRSDPAYNPAARILAVRIWLRLRSDVLEVSAPAPETLTYADQTFRAVTDGYRRTVVSKTIYLRNARPAS